MATIVKYKGGWRALIRKVGFPFTSKVFRLKSEAEKWAKSVEATMDGQQYLAPSKVKVHALFQRFADEVSPTRKGSRWEQVRIARLIRTCRWMSKNVDDLDRFDVQEWRDARLKEVSSSSVNRELNLISGVISHAMREWGISLRVNPVHEIKRPPKGKARNRRVTSVEQASLDDAFKFDETPPRTGYGAVKDTIMWVFHLAKETGMRSGELLDLEWDDVHLDEGWVFVKTSKNGEARVIPLTERAEHLFRKLTVAGATVKVFPVNKGSFEVTYRRTRNALGIDLRMHDTRHEAASNMAKSLSPMELSKVLGHKDPRTTMIYYNPTAAELVKKLRSG